jgi:putative ABC transport system ATP-binding protein
MDPVLTVTDLTKTFASPDGPVMVLDGVGLTLTAGQTLALTGESGSGKSTFLHAIAGLEPVDGGTIRIGDASMTVADEATRAALRRDRIGLVFQGFNLIPSLTVAANIAFQARLAGRHDPSRAAGLADRLGLTAQLAKYPEALSGGQQQRVAIARALLARPALLLADEPTGSLDAATADQVMAEMLALVAETGAALLMVTHSDRLASRLDRRLHLAAGRIA